MRKITEQQFWVTLILFFFFVITQKEIIIET